MKLVLGVDTSNYTTSLCAISAESGELRAEARQLLPVTEGQRGLRQSDALFFHVQRLPSIMARLCNQLERDAIERIEWVGIGVSVRPRPLCSSYMPVFLAGHSFAETFATALGIPLVPTSHQEGHLAAAQYFLPQVGDRPFLAVHLSGGTSDVLYARKTRFGYQVRTLGEGMDLHAGQFVDRVGVALGLQFPSGPALERLANEAPRDCAFRLNARVQGCQLSFSGPCSAALRAIQQGVQPSHIAFAVQACIASSVVKALQMGFKQHPEVDQCVIAGGVASNQWIQARILHRMRMTLPQVAVRFAPPRFSSDNALGTAAIAYEFIRS